MISDGEFEDLNWLWVSEWFVVKIDFGEKPRMQGFVKTQKQVIQ